MWEKLPLAPSPGGGWLDGIFPVECLDVLMSSEREGRLSCTNFQKISKIFRCETRAGNLNWPAKTLEPARFSTQSLGPFRIRDL